MWKVITRTKRRLKAQQKSEELLKKLSSKSELRFPFPPLFTYQDRNMTENHLSHFEGRQVYPICPRCRETKSPALLWFAVWSVGSKCGSVFWAQSFVRENHTEGGSANTSKPKPVHEMLLPARRGALFCVSTWRLAQIGCIFVKREGFFSAEDAWICKIRSGFVVMFL